MATTQRKSRVEITVIGEVVRLGKKYPKATSFTNEDGSKRRVIYFDIRAHNMPESHMQFGSTYKIAVYGDRAIEAFKNGEFEHRSLGAWYLFKPPGIGDWIQVTGSYALKDPTEDFDRAQHTLNVWEPWHIRRITQTKRPAKKDMQAW